MPSSAAPQETKFDVFCTAADSAQRVGRTLKFLGCRHSLTAHHFSLSSSRATQWKYTEHVRRSLSLGGRFPMTLTSED